MTELRIGVEVGGTFTDFVGFYGNKITIKKVPSTPREPDRGVFAAIEAAGIALDAISDFGHGSTVATNAVLERKGARICFVTTKGFRDILLLQRHDRHSIYDLAYQKPAPLLERRHCFEVPERILADGTVESPLDIFAVMSELVPRLVNGDYEAVAICLLNSYANAEHERTLAKVLQDQLPGVLIACSSDVAREFREYERASTTALSAFVQPVIDRYLHRMETRLQQGRFDGRLTVMQSNGGRLPARAMRNNAISALLSGPAAGVVGAVKQVGLSGYHDLITFDMGGTSADVCLINEGKPSLVHQTTIDGLPIQTPMLDIVTVGGGGGSIIWIDEGGMLRVGPRSAGADPGPACYGLGGKRPTITDAQVICGAVRPEAFLGGRMALDIGAARSAMSDVAEQFDTSVEGLADSAIKLVNANIVRAIQLVSTERGQDPRDYVLVPFGGGGPLHAASIADELGIRTVVIPPNPGVLSAYGLLASDFTKFAGATRRMPLEEVASAGRATLEELRDALVSEFPRMGLTGTPNLSYTLDMRFVGQAFEVQVPVASIDDLNSVNLLEAFQNVHQQVYHHGANQSRPVEIVAFRVEATLPAPMMPSLQFEPGDHVQDRLLPLYINKEWTECRHSSGAGLLEHEPVNGPLIIAGETSTTFIPAGWTCHLDSHHNLILTRMLP